MGFQSARQQFDAVFRGIRDDIELLLLKYNETNKRTLAKKVESDVDKILEKHSMRSRVYNEMWETIEGKTRPKVPDNVPKDERDEWLLLFLLGWVSFGKKLPNRLNNTINIISDNYKKTTKRIHNEWFLALNNPSSTSKVNGVSLSPAVRRQYENLLSRNPRQAQQYFETEMEKLVVGQLDKVGRKRPKHYSERVTETESLTIRMDLELQNAGKSGEIDYITIFVKPNACQLCESFRGVRYPKGKQPHLLAHPSCRCDYIIHYVNGERLVIPGSGRIDLK